MIVAPFQECASLALLCIPSRGVEQQLLAALLRDHDMMNNSYLIAPFQECASHALLCIPSRGVEQQLLAALLRDLDMVKNSYSNLLYSYVEVNNFYLFCLTSAYRMQFILIK